MSGPSSASPSTPTAKSPHTADPLLAPFRATTFDPTAYLNAALPPLGVPTPAQPVRAARSQPLAAVAAEARAHAQRLGAHAARLDAALAALADETLRAGPRLGYAVEVLRGEVASLGLALAGRVRGAGGAAENGRGTDGEGTGKDDDAGGREGKGGGTSRTGEGGGGADGEPAAVAGLRELLRVRARLQDVVATFDAALQWPLAPSAASLGAALVSVSGPAAAADAGRSLEAQGQAAQAALRESVVQRLGSGGAEGVCAAEARVTELQALVGVWRGTAEEKPRAKFVEGLARMVAEKRREEERRGAMPPKGAEEGRESGRGLFGGLRRLRDEIYLE